MDGLHIDYLTDNVDLISLLSEWFVSEWPEWYGPGRGHDARSDLQAACNKRKLPIALVAFLDDNPVGIARLKSDSIPTHAHLTPWVTAGLVRMEYRNRGIGAELLKALEKTATALGYSSIYCGTAKAGSLLERAGWSFLEFALWDNEKLGVYKKFLG